MSINPNFAKLVEAVRDYMDALEDKETCEDTIVDYENPIFEAAVMCLYGEKAFDYINKKIDEFD